MNSNPRRDNRRESLRPYNSGVLPLHNLIQGQNGAGTAITRAIRSDNMLQPGNTPWHTVRSVGYPQIQN